MHETCKAITDSDAVSQFVLTRVAVTSWKVTFVYIMACANQGVKVNLQLRQASSELRLFTRSLGLGVHILDIVFQRGFLFGKILYYELRQLSRGTSRCRLDW